MRKAAEAPDDLAMTLGLGEDRLANRSSECNRTLLVAEILRVSERNIKEEPQVRFDAMIMPARKRGIGDLACKRVRGIHPRRPAKGVARELVEQDRKRPRAYGRFQPCRERLTGRCFVQPQKPFPKSAIKVSVFGKPTRGPGVPPEGYDGFGIGWRLRSETERSGRTEQAAAISAA